MNESDKVIDALLAKVEAKKKELKKLSRPNWLTSCVFGPGRTDKKNIQVITDVKTLVEFTATLLAMEKEWEAANELLETNEKLVIDGYSVADWIADFKLRVGIIGINAKKKEIEAIEAKLNALISPEKRREIELKQLAQLLEE